MKIKKLEFKGFGFPIELRNVPATIIRGSTEPVINYKDLAKKVISELCSDANHSPLTGHQVFFLRNHLSMTIREFGNFVDTTHAAVKKWENCGDHTTMMSTANEKMMRLKVLEKVGVKPALFLEIFKNLDIHRVADSSVAPILRIAL